MINFKDTDKVKLTTPAIDLGKNIILKLPLIMSTDGVEYKHIVTEGDTVGTVINAWNNHMKVRGPEQWCICTAGETCGDTHELSVVEYQLITYIQSDGYDANYPIAEGTKVVMPAQTWNDQGLVDVNLEFTTERNMMLSEITLRLNTLLTEHINATNGKEWGRDQLYLEGVVWKTPSEIYFHVGS